MMRQIPQHLPFDVGSDRGRYVVCLSDGLLPGQGPHGRCQREVRSGMPILSVVPDAYAFLPFSPRIEEKL